MSPGRYDRDVILATLVAQQVDEGDTEVLNLRETDPALGSLITLLILLGVLTLVATVIFWWLTRPSRSGNTSDLPDQTEGTEQWKTSTQPR